MKEDKKVRGALFSYMQWPILLSVLVICANIAVQLVSRQAGIVMFAFTAIYLICAGTAFFFSRKRALAELVAFASVYNENQKQLLASMELPYGIADTDGRLLWVNRAMEAILKNEKAARRSLPVLFKEITPESLADMEHGLEAHVSYGEARYKVSVKRVDLHLGNEETRTGVEKELMALFGADGQASLYRAIVGDVFLLTQNNADVLPAEIIQPILLELKAGVGFFQLGFEGFEEAQGGRLIAAGEPHGPVALGLANAGVCAPVGPLHEVPADHQVLLVLVVLHVRDGSHVAAGGNGGEIPLFLDAVPINPSHCVVPPLRHRMLGGIGSQCNDRGTRRFPRSGRSSGSCGDSTCIDDNRCRLGRESPRGNSPLPERGRGCTPSRPGRYQASGLTS